MIRQIGGAEDQTRDPCVQGKWFIHYIMVAPITTETPLANSFHAG